MIGLATLQTLRNNYSQNSYLTLTKDSVERHTSPGESALNLLPDTSVASGFDSLA